MARTVRLSGRRFAVGLAAVVLSTVVGSAGVAPRAVASVPSKVVGSERALLTELLTEVFDGPPSAASLTCIANRLPAGTVAGVIGDVLAAGNDEAALADSIAFRGLFRNVLLCKPKELVGPMAAELNVAGLTSTQRRCIASGLVGRMALDDNLLTLIIRGGLTGLDTSDLDPAIETILAANVLVAARPCVPKARLADLVDAVLDAL